MSAEAMRDGEHVEGVCDECTRKYPVWFAPNELWNQTMQPIAVEERPHMLCPSCFVDLAESAGVDGIFKVCISDDVDRQLAHMTHERNHYIRRCQSLEARLLTAAGDDLCRLTQEEIKAMSAGAVKIPPKEEFLASCERFHAQVAGEVGVNENCLTLAQLIAENEKLKSLEAENARLRLELDGAKKRIEYARQSLIADGYFTPAEVGDDIAPRISEILVRYRDKVALAGGPT